MTDTLSNTDHGDPADWDEMPDGYGAVIARALEDDGWHVTDYDDTVVNVTAADGTETGVWFTHGKCWTGRAEDGHCNNPVDILADLADPEEIAGRTDTVMREIGLKPGHPDIEAWSDELHALAQRIGAALEHRGDAPTDLIAIVRNFAQTVNEIRDIVAGVAEPGERNVEFLVTVIAPLDEAAGGLHQVAEGWL